MSLPAELEVLYTEYLREVHASSFSAQEAETVLEQGGGAGDSGGSEDSTRLNFERVSLPPLAATPTGYVLHGSDAVNRAPW